ncbi:hypothetical protein F1C58_16605 (plasmid) [Glaciihabitans sp. INWT7]|uniref:GspE/PulE family protein n=1 Tax=Glaciihabitans sp. INWT7 TaxID=2596912 RepID=UPI0016298825|nr:ATPase, T2SS/T4P/T4SS family [Glaciihabitans sp. INWT7]QNE48678.1 hypothetical protein F1C58_16605 [Glaciihabitans sp. INWT7]
MTDNDPFERLMEKTIHPVVAPIVPSWDAVPPSTPIADVDDLHLAEGATEVPSFMLPFTPDLVAAEPVEVPDEEPAVAEAAVADDTADDTAGIAAPETPFSLNSLLDEDAEREAAWPVRVKIEPETLQLSSESDTPDDAVLAVLIPRGVRPALAGLIQDHPAGQWLEGALHDMVNAGVSDVHLNMSGIDKSLTIQARIDGDLEAIRRIEGREATVIMNMLKTSAELSTSSSLVPDDGRYELPMNGFPYRVRAVSLPLFDGGEKIVLRLPQIGELRTLDTMGATDENIAAIRELLLKPSGMILIAGPVGEGKTTTAHLALTEIGTEGKAVIAVEDPVERVLPGVSQIEVQEEVGAGFSDIMRYLVRSDFDTLFIGEIRDSATAAAAVRMAKAGRRVISTIHASDNVTALLRLIELSDDTPLSVLDAVSGVISQRLVKKLDGEGGYHGRHAIHEVLLINDDLADRLIENKSLSGVRAAAAESSTTFAANLKYLVTDGVTDNDEARRVVGHDV